MTIFIDHVTTQPDAPKRETEGASGYDLRAVAWRRAHEGSEVRRTTTIDLDPGERVLVYTDRRFAIPHGYEGQVRPRSGLTLRHGVVAMFGTIDADYRGEVGVTLMNLGDSHARIEMGERIAQLVFARIEHAVFVRVEELSETARGEGGFGSTGKR